jgi:hypothetical protein
MAKRSVGSGSAWLLERRMDSNFVVAPLIGVRNPAVGHDLLGIEVHAPRGQQGVEMR